MAKTIIRQARDLRDGDAIILDRPAMGGELTAAVVQEKVLAEDGQVSILLLIPEDTSVFTLPRPSEVKDPFDAAEDEA